MGMPVIIEIGAPVLVVAIAGVDDGRLYHLPLPVRQTPGPGGNTYPVELAGRLREGRVPVTWETLCGLEHGSVFRYAGVIRRRRLCTVCLRRAPAEHTDPCPPGRLAIRDAHVAALRLAHRNGVPLRILAKQAADRLGFSSVADCQLELERLLDTPGAAA